MKKIVALARKLSPRVGLIRILPVRDEAMSEGTTDIEMVILWIAPPESNSQNDSRIPESSGRLRPMPSLPVMESPLNMAVPSPVELQRIQTEAMRKDFERSIERVRAESEMNGQEYREEMKRGLNVVHDHIRRLDELSRQERADNAMSLKELT